MQAYCGLRFIGFPIASRKMALFPFALGRKELNHVIVEEGQAGRTEMRGIHHQIHPAADGTGLQLAPR